MDPAATRTARASERGAKVGFEIERKYLVRGERWRELVRERVSIRQAYLSSDGKASIRVRIKDERTATLTIKSKPAGLRRLELEYPVPVVEAEALMQLRQGAIIQKVRHVVPWHDLAWEIDVFSGENSGLVIAEIELRDEHQVVDLPDWIGPEVTGQRPFYNGFLMARPFRSWPKAGDGSIQMDKLA